MLKKIVSIKNVGRFFNFGVSGDLRLSRYSLIHGANGFGKTTLCAILRSLQTGDPGYVLGRETLGETGATAIKLLLEGNKEAIFQKNKWNVTRPEIAIFDSVFVKENIHSGEVVDIKHKRNLYRVIVGADGAKLAEQEAKLAEESRKKTSEISNVSRTIQSHSAGMKLDQFLALQEKDNIAAEIEAQERSVEAMRQAGELRDRTSLLEFSIPALPGDFTNLLARTIDDIAQDAEQKLSAHLAKHDMTASGGNWISEGLSHTADTCPFCGQDIRDFSMITAFRAVFSGRYKALAEEIATMKGCIVKGMGDATLAALYAIVERNKADVEFWKKYCLIDTSAVALPANALEAVHALATAAVKLLDAKATTPLEPIRPDANFTAVRVAYDEALAAVETVNVAIRKANSIIASRKAAADVDNLKAAEDKLKSLRAIQTRHRADVAELCTTYENLNREKYNIETDKEAVRKQLNAHTETVVKPYEQHINNYLDMFNAGFTIAKTKHAYPGGIATSSYQLVINGTTVDLGDSKTPEDQPSFKNTLSDGDRTTLALAFFLAHLESDPTATRKLVVFDDPLSSQDAFRRRQTVHEIMKVARKCAQVIVLSHDAAFLKLIWDKSPIDERAALMLVDQRSQGSKIMPFDLEGACRGRTVADIDDLQSYLASGRGRDLDIIRKIRVVLETYCRATYPSSFLDNEWLGSMVKKLREDGDAHPAQALYEELDLINSYTSKYHHGENIADATPDQIDPTELAGFVRRTLRIVNALQT